MSLSRMNRSNSRKMPNHLKNMVRSILKSIGIVFNARIVLERMVSERLVVRYTSRQRQFSRASHANPYRKLYAWGGCGSSLRLKKIYAKTVAEMSMISDF